MSGKSPNVRFRPGFSFGLVEEFVMPVLFPADYKTTGFVPKLVFKIIGKRACLGPGTSHGVARSEPHRGDTFNGFCCNQRSGRRPPSLSILDSQLKKFLKNRLKRNRLVFFIQGSGILVEHAHINMPSDRDRRYEL